MNTVACFEIHSGQSESAVRFYQELFGWPFTRDENLPIAYWRIETNGNTFGIFQPDPAAR